MSRAARQARSRGFTLIEVLIAILIFSFGLLGFAALQARAIQFSVSAEDTNRAALLANDMAATMVSKNSVDPSAAVLAADVSAWQSRVTTPTVAGLPNSSASAVMNTPKLATLTIRWRPAGVAASAANATNQYVTQVVLP